MFFAIFQKTSANYGVQMFWLYCLLPMVIFYQNFSEFFKLNIEIAQNIFCHFSIVVENMGVSNENLLKIDIRILFL